MQVSGVTGWVLASYNDYQIGNVWTINPPSNAITSAPIPAGGLTVAHLWRFFWEDGSGDINTLPTPGVVANEPACPSSSATPTLSNTATASTTPTPSNTPSITPSNSASPSYTPSATASPSNTQIATPSITPSNSVSTSFSSSPSATASATATVTSSASQTNTGSATATSSPGIASNGLLVDLRAEDYNATSGMWINRVSVGNVSEANGDFGPLAGATAASIPSKCVVSGMPAVCFNATSAGVSQQLVTAFPTLSSSTIWGPSDWSIEMWVYSAGDETSTGLAPVFQWGQRPGTACDSAAIGVGAAATTGATTYYNTGTATSCTSGWASQSSNTGGTLLQTGFGYRPRINTWHHIVVTYTGTTNSPPLTQTIYLDGVTNSATSSLSLAIRRDMLRLGAWVDASSAVAIAQFRIHDGPLSLPQVQFNYGQFSGVYVHTQTPSITSTPSPSSTVTATSTTSATGTQTRSSSNTASSTGSPSNTASSSNTPTSSQIATSSSTVSTSLTASATVSKSVSSSMTPTPTATLHYIGRSTLIELRAIDYDAVNGVWDNRLTTGAVSFANGVSALVTGIAVIHSTRVQCEY